MRDTEITDKTPFGDKCAPDGQNAERISFVGHAFERGIGIDMVEIPRIESSIKRPNFLNRFFGGRELAEYKSRGGKASYIAANFCAKEAFSKAIGTGIRGFELREVELLRNPLGKPYLVFSGRAAKIVNGLNIGFEASVSHTKQYAVAVVEAFRIGKGNVE